MKKTRFIIISALALVLILTLSSAYAQTYTFGKEVKFELPDNFFYQGKNANGWDVYASIYPAMTFNISYNTAKVIVTPREHLGTADLLGGTEAIVNYNGFEIYVYYGYYNGPYCSCYFNSSTAAYWMEFKKYKSGDQSALKIIDNVIRSLRFDNGSKDIPDKKSEKQTLKTKIQDLKVTDISTKSIKIKWKKLSMEEQKKAKKIEIQVSTNKNFKSDVTTKKIASKKDSITIKNLKPGKKYYVRVRALKEDGNTIHVSKWYKKNITLKE